MVIEKNHAIRGRPNDIMRQLKQRTGSLAHHAKEFYIGATTHPVVRAGVHRRWGWRRMVILFETSSLSDAQRVERALVAWLSTSRHNSKVLNLAGGGAGLVPGTGLYKVYALVS